MSIFFKKVKMENIKNILLIVLFIILIACGIFGAYLYYQNIQKNKELQRIELQLIERDKQVEELKNKQPITIEKFVKLQDKQKDIEYKKLLDNYRIAMSIIDNDKLIIEDLQKLIKKDKLDGISLFAAGGIDKTFSPEILVGGTYDRYFRGKLLTGKLSAGAYAKVYENQGGGVMFGGGFSW